MTKDPRISRHMNLKAMAGKMPYKQAFSSRGCRRTFMVLNGVSKQA